MDRIDKTFINALFTPEYYMGYRSIDAYMSKVLLAVLEDSGVGAYMRSGPRRIDDVMGKFGFHPQSRALLAWAVRYLELGGFVDGKDGIYRLKPGPFETDTSGDESLITGYAPTASIFIELVKRIVPDLGDFLHGRKKGRDILFAGETRSLWDDYFNNKFLGYSVLNYGAAYGITKWFSETGGKSMLEVGSGTSGATVKVFQMLNDNSLLDGMDRILLTDVVPPLLELGRKNIDSQISPPPAYGQMVLDINMPFEEQGLAGERFDVIFGVNVLHVARELAFSLREIHSHLNEGGILVISETIRPAADVPMHHEIIFNLLSSYYDVDLAPGTRPSHGFLTEELWTKNLEAAGFKGIECITELKTRERLDIDIRPLHSFLVVKGRK